MTALSDFFYMGGYAFYVWLSYGIAALVLIANALWPGRQRKRILWRIKYAQTRQEKLSKRQQT